MSLAIIRVFGIAIFLYLTWRNLKDDYEGESLISFGWLAILGFIIFGRFGFGLMHWGVWSTWKDWISVWQKPGMDYLIAGLGFALVTFWFGKIKQWKFIPFLEDNLKNFLILLFFMMTDELLRSRFDIKVVFYLISLIIVYLVSWWLGKKYRSFVWYRSGKKGFVVLGSLFLFYLLTFGILLWFKESWFLIGLSLLLNLISLIGLFILGEVFLPLTINRRK